MVPFDSAVFPIVGIRGLVGVEAISGFSPDAEVTNGVNPAIGVKGASPEVVMEIGANIARFVPGIIGIDPIP